MRWPFLSRSKTSVPFGPTRFGGTLDFDAPTLDGRRSRRAPRKHKRSRWIASVDIGTTKVCVIIAEALPDGAIAVRGVGSEPSRGMAQGVVTNISETVNSLLKAYADAYRFARVHPRETLVGIAGDHIIGTPAQATVEVSNPESGVDMRDCLRACGKALKICLPEDMEILHVFHRGYVVDERKHSDNPVSLHGHRLQAHVHVVSSAKADADNLYRCLRRAKLKNSSILLQALASSQAVLTPRERDTGVAMVDIGGGTSDIAVFYDNKLQHTAEVALGGDSITEDIRQTLRCSVQDAENLKKKKGCAVPLQVDADEQVEMPGTIAGGRRITHSRRWLAEIVEARVEEIFQQIRQRLEEAHMHKHIYSGVVLSGGTALLAGIEQVGERILECPCRIGRPDGLVDMSSVVNTPIYSTAVGLVQWAAQEGPGYRREHWLTRRLRVVLGAMT